MLILFHGLMPDDDMRGYYIKLIGMWHFVAKEMINVNILRTYKI